MSSWRKWFSFFIRLILLVLLILALSGFEWRIKNNDMNVVFLVDRSQSIPAEQQEAARQYVNAAVKEKKPNDKAGIIVFGEDAGIEMMPNTVLEWTRFQAVINPEATELGSALKLATAAFPDDAQKKIVVLSDANSDPTDMREAAISARSQDVTIDTIALGANRPNDVVVEPLQLPNQLKKGQAFNLKTVVTSTVAQEATMQVFRNQQFIGEEKIILKKGENAFSFEEKLSDPGFYQYEVRIDAPADGLVQNNRSFGQTFIKGDPSIMLVTDSIEADSNLIQSLNKGDIKVVVKQPSEVFADSESLRFFDAMILSNIGAGQFSTSELQLLESLVKDFGMGMVVIGGDQAFTAGSYRGTPLEDMLPLSMELDSKKVLPRGALVLIMHGMEFMNGNEVARQMGLGTLDALGSEDELGVLLWDGQEKWLFELAKVGENKKSMKDKIAGMNQGDLPSFRGLIDMAYEGLTASTANIKHVIVFSDGDPTPPTLERMAELRAANITVSTVLIAGHATDDNMVFMAEEGNGNFYFITDPRDLPQIFLQETAIILKSAIVEEPFGPELVGTGEPIRGINAFPQLKGYVATVPKDRAAIPIQSPKGDPILGYWNYGLGRVVAFTSDARARWASDWLQWGQYDQFWQQITQWSLRKVESSSLDVNVTQNGTNAEILIEALDDQGDFLNFLNLSGVALDPNGKSQPFTLQQSGPGQYKASFPMASQGAYQINIMEREGGQVKSMTLTGTSLSYSPEYRKATTDLSLLTRLAEWGGGTVVDPEDQTKNPFNQGRTETFTPRPIWDQLLKWALLLFIFDIGFRRIDLEKRQIKNFMLSLAFWKSKKSDQEVQTKLSSLKKSRDAAKSQGTPQQPARQWTPASKATDFSKPVEEAAKQKAKKAVSKSDKESKKSEPKSTSAPSRISSQLLAARRKAKDSDDNNREK